MKARKALILACMLAASMGIGGTVAAEEEPATEPVTEAVTETETEAVTEAETEDVFKEGTATLLDLDYEAGALDEDGWSSDFLEMLYLPEENVSMGVEQNVKVNEYHLRHGEDKVRAVNEMIALTEDGNYIQLAVEANPNYEKAGNVLSRFAEIEGLKLVSKTAETSIGGKTFLTCTGISDNERYMLGICTEKEGFAVALKIHYQNTDVRKLLLSGFKENLEDEDDSTVENVTESETEFAGIELSMDKDFEDAQIIEDPESETVSTELSSE